MKSIKSFSDFINEETFSADFLSLAKELTADLFKAKSKEELQSLGKIGITPDTQPVTIGAPTSAAGSGIGTPSAGYSPVPVSAVPGNDDFMLYMQHQQGVAGAKGLIQASQGTGSMHPETVKTKYIKRLGKNVKYANLVLNVPSDRPEILAGIIKSLDNGDQKTAARLFLSMWKEKWNSKGESAKKEILKPQNAKVKDAIARYSAEMNVPFDFAITVALIESGFNPNAGNAYYKGLFALSPKGFSKYSPGGNIHDIEDNAKAGIMTLRDNIKEFKSYLGPTVATLNFGDWVDQIS